MSARRSPIPLVLALLAAGCADEIGLQPSAVQPSLAPAPHFLRWVGDAAPQFRAIGALSGRVFASGGAGELSLDHNAAMFWAVRGQQRSVQINYRSSTGDTSALFLRLVVVDPMYVPVYGDLAPGDSVLITVTVDPRNIKVSLEPSGLLFGDPAQLQISYSGADGDLNADGVVDDSDAQIERQLLGIWYREGAESPWAKIPAVQSLSDKAFITALQHFSEYAVSW